MLLGVTFFLIIVFSTTDMPRLNVIDIQPSGRRIGKLRECVTTHASL